jgi:hypothetical protein
MKYIGPLSSAEQAEAMTNPLYPPVQVIDTDYDFSNFEFFSIPGLEQKLAEDRGTYFLHPRFASELGLENGQMIESLHFAHREDWAVGREDSTQVVFFGEADISVDDGQTHNVGLAVKPYNIFHRDRAIHEYVALEHFHDDPHLKSYEPLGFWVDSTGYPFLLTRFEESVISLDNAQWDKDGDNPLKEHFSLFEALQRSAQILARLHIRGFTHRDAQIKNMAIDTNTDTIRLIDLTKLAKIHEVDEPREIEWERAVADDLRTLVASVRRRGYLRGEAVKDSRNMVNMALLAIHASIVRHPSSRPSLFPDASRMVTTIDKDILNEVG